MARASFVLAVVLSAPAFAGCLQQDDGGEAPSPTEGPLPVGPAEVMAFRGDGSPVAPGDIPIVASVLRELGVDTFEPTLGVAPDGAIYYSATGDGVLIGFGPLVMKSVDQGATWEDVSPRLPTGDPAPPETNDPYVYVDPSTGRVFQFAMAPILVCSVLSWSDDGGATWTTNPHGCFTTPPWDHQTMVAAAPRSLPTQGYANVLHQCVNSVYVAQCSRSLDGGLSWSPGAPAFAGVDPTAGLPDPMDPLGPPVCGGLHGHLKAAPDGTVYLPKAHCGRPYVAITRDDGSTWDAVLVSDVPALGEPDPAVAVDAAGNVYYAFVDEAGALLLTVSTDAGATWSEAVVASPPGVTTHIPALAAGGEGRIVLAYPGTPDLAEGYAAGDDEQEDAAWHAYVTFSTDALSATPSFFTVRANPAADPLVRGPCGPGRCPGMVDFIDVVVGPDGRPYAAFVDACQDACAKPDGTADDMDASAALLVTLAEAPLLREPAATTG